MDISWFRWEVDKSKNIEESFNCISSCLIHRLQLYCIFLLYYRSLVYVQLNPDVKFQVSRMCEKAGWKIAAVARTLLLLPLVVGSLFETGGSMWADWNEISTYWNMIRPKLTTSDKLTDANVSNVTRSDIWLWKQNFLRYSTARFLHSL